MPLTPNKHYIDLYLRGTKHFGLLAEYVEVLGAAPEASKVRLSVRPDLTCFH
jgi:hypothetical protein